MTGSRNKVIKLAAPPPDSGRLLAQGLVDLYKAIKGASFYPSGHPYRMAPLQRSFDALSRLVQTREVVLTVGRQGFVPPVEAADGNVMLLQLAQECLMRRIAAVTFTRDLLMDDLEAFVELLSRDPQKGASLGGCGRQLEASGVRSVIIQDKDLSAVWAKRSAAASERPESGSSESAPHPPVSPAPFRGLEDHTIAELLTLMAQESDDAPYQQLGRELVEKFPHEPGEFAVLPVLEELLRQHEEPAKSLPQREYALFTLERLAEGTADLLMDSLEKRECPDKKGILRVLAALGGKGAYHIIQRLCLAQGVMERKALAAALVRLGPAATAPVIAMLKDDRWYVVRNMATILGEIRSPEAVVPLKNALGHEDERVRKEAVRALMKIGGDSAEATLITLLDNPEQNLVRHAILSLGLMKSRQAVVPLIKLMERNDLFLKKLALKKEASLALGRIGDARATAVLLKMLGSRGWPALGRSLELKAAVASALGAIGDEAALPALEALSKGNGALAEACREAIDAVERVSGGSGD